MRCSSAESLRRSSFVARAGAEIAAGECRLSGALERLAHRIQSRLWNLKNRNADLIDRVMHLRAGHRERLRDGRVLHAGHGLDEEPAWSVFTLRFLRKAASHRRQA